MLKRNSRIGKTLFNELNQKRAPLRHYSYFSLRAGPLSSKGGSKFACVVSSKNFKKATERNRVRRACYSALSRLYKDIKPGYFGVFSIKRGAEKLTASLWENEIKRVLREASLL